MRSPSDTKPDVPVDPGGPRWGAALVALVLLPALPLLTGRGALIQHDINISDLLHSHFPYRAFLGESLRGGHFPLWMPDAFFGTPLAGQIEAGSFYPPHWLIFGLLEPWHAMGVSIAADLLLAAAGCWLLARRYGADRVSAALAAVAFAWCGHMVSHARHPNMHATFALLPWATLATERLLSSGGRRGGPALGLAVGGMVLAGHPQVTYVAMLFLGARLLSALPGTDRAGWLPRIGAFTAAAALGAGLGAVALGPAVHFTGAAQGELAASWEYATQLPFQWRDLLSFVAPSAVGAMETYDYRGAGLPWGNYAYCGLAPLALSAAAVAAARGRVTGFYAGIGLLGLAASLGEATPVFWLLWTAVPGMKLFRFPNRFLLPVMLAVAVLGALGLARLVRAIRARRPGPLGPLVAALVVLGTMADLGQHARPRFPIDDAAPWRDRGAVARMIDGGSAPGRVYTFEEWQHWERAFHQARGFTEGFEPYRNAWMLPLGTGGSLKGLRSATGYTRMIHHRSAALWQPYPRPSSYPAFVPYPRDDRGRITRQQRSLLDRWGVRYLVSLTPLEDEGLTRLGSVVWENQRALPRAWVAGEWVAADDLEAAARWVLDGGLDRPRVPAIEGAEAASGGAPGEATVEERGPNALEITLGDHGGGMLIVADSWDEGWRATVDGAPAPVLPANGCQRAVPVPAGARVVRMDYHPPWLGASLAVTGASAILLLAWSLAARRRSAGEDADAD